MDPLSILGIAAGVVQFIDFGSRLLSKARSGYVSASSQALEVVAISVIINDLEHFGEMLASGIGLLTPGILFGDSERDNLLQICKDCDNAKLEWTAAIKGLDDHSRSYRFPFQTSTSNLGDGENSFVAMLLNTRALDVEKWRYKLEDLRARLTITLLAVLWKQSSNSSQELEKISSQQAVLAQTLARLESNTKGLNQSVVKIANRDKPDPDPKRQSTIDSIWSSSWSRNSSDNRESPSGLPYCNAIVDSLTFTGLSHREEAIPQAHQKTCEWIFSEPRVSTDDGECWSSFNKWLVSSEQEIYWITGKIGAGKSTLMKFIVSHQRTKQLLQQWSGSKPLVICSFYFWNPGNELQKAKNGLMRTFLQQFLRTIPSLAPKICPRRWALLSICGLVASSAMPNWAWAELMESFLLIVPHIGKLFNLALFIDGLDEFDGNHQELVDIVQLLGKHEGTKICVSSRPWNIFSDAFVSNPSLRMEDLTAEDIEIFVRGQFNGTRAFKELDVADPIATEHLVRSITKKAKGVFLWVSVVACALCEGLSDGDRFSDLLAELERLPDEMSGLYTSIWSGIKPKHLKNSSELFQLREVAPAYALDTLTWWLADNENALDEDINKIRHNSKKMDHIAQEMRRRLSSRTRGLLEVTSDGLVDYVHRSVRDWQLNKLPEIRSAAPEFDVHLALLKAFTVQISETGLWETHDAGTAMKFWTKVCTCFHYASKVKGHPQQIGLLVQCLDRFDYNCSKIWHSYNAHIRGIEGKLALCRGLSITTMTQRNEYGVLSYWPTTQHTPAPNMLQTSFLNLACQFSVVPYVKYKVTRNPKLVRGEPTCMALLPCAVWGFAHFSWPDPENVMVRDSDPDEWKMRLELANFLVDKGEFNLDSEYTDQIEKLYDDIHRRAAYYLEAPFHDEPEEAQYWKDLSNMIKKSQSEPPTNRIRGKLKGKWFKIVRRMF
ncbi:hypothetical protein F4782DRAFT_504231 [Xylaria castorea]|nr:hypothetical protein F4782DRAFT_504231 [Xylaria castorea]